MTQGLPVGMAATLATLLVGLAGCAGTTTTGTSPATPAATAPAPVDMNTAPGSGRTVYASWDSPGKVLVIDREPAATAPGGRWRASRLSGPTMDHLTPESDQLFERGPDGSISLAEEIDHAEQVEVVFDPPMLIVPARLEPGMAPIAQSFTMLVYPLGDRTRTRSRGPATVEITCPGDEEVGVPGATIMARRLDSVLRADLAPARVRNETSRYFAPGPRLIAERERERTTFAGLPVRNNKSAWVVAE